MLIIYRIKVCLCFTVQAVRHVCVSLACIVQISVILMIVCVCV